jgi:hypothetical protein
MSESSDYFVFSMVLGTLPVGVDLTIDDFRPELELAQVRPTRFGPLFAQAVRAGDLISTGRCAPTTTKPSLNGGLRRIYQRPAPAARSRGRGSARAG